MPIAESEIAILIPTYRYKEKVVRAVQSALSSGAGEVIVVDDASKDGTIERLAEFTDPRLAVHENVRNLGLWENHLRALNMTKRSWIKFIQADDYLLPGGLAEFARAAGPGISVVWGAATMKDDITGETTYHYALRAPRRLPAQSIQEACLECGWLLGSPSYMMLRTDVIERDACLWRKQMSADLVAGSIAAARGDTVLLPQGAIGHGSHAAQDARTQSSVLGVERAAHSLMYLRNRAEPGLRRLANLWTALTLKTMVRSSIGGIARRDGSLTDFTRPLAKLFRSLTPDDFKEIIASRSRLRRAIEFRRTSRPPFDLDRLFGEHGL